jgi:Ca-activated chloride channel family protein
VYSAAVPRPGSIAALLAVLGWGLAAAQREPAFRTGVELVRIGATVTDRAGALVTGLAADDFEVFEDGVRQTVRLFAAGDGESAPELHVGLLLDVSDSMAEELAFTRTAAIRFLRLLPEAVDFTVVDFDTEVRVARFGPADFPRLVERIRQQEVSGWTALYDAIGVYLDGASRRDGRTVMLLYSDGGDTRSALRRRELIDLLRASDVTVYAVGSVARRAGRLRLEHRQVLREIAEVTGGQVFFPSAARDLDRVYEQVLAEIRAQYTLGYRSTNPRADGAWRRVEVEVAGNRRVRSRPGYYAPLRAP